MRHTIAIYLVAAHVRLYWPVAIFQGCDRPFLPSGRAVQGVCKAHEGQNVKLTLHHDRGMSRTARLMPAYGRQFTRTAHPVCKAGQHYARTVALFRSMGFNRDLFDDIALRAKDHDPTDPKDLAPIARFIAVRAPCRRRACNLPATPTASPAKAAVVSDAHPHGHGCTGSSVERERTCTDARAQHAASNNGNHHAPAIRGDQDQSRGPNSGACHFLSEICGA